MTNRIRLSDRLETVANHIKDNSCLADIGSDHAYLPCYLCMKNSNFHAIASEVNYGPYKRAQETVQLYNLTHQIDVRLGNGLEVIQHEDAVDTISITGMGGSLITSILSEGKEKLRNVKRIITQPNNNAYAIRKFLYKHNYIITAEEIIEENGHIYEIIVSDYLENNKHVNTLEEDDEKQFLFGPKLMEEKSIAFIKKWQNEKIKLNKIIGQMKQAQEENECKILEFKQRIKWIEEVLD